MDPTQAILVGGVVPGLVALVILLIAWRPWQTTAPHGQWGGPMALGGAMAAGYLLVPTFSRLRFPPADSNQWLLAGTWGLAVLGLLLSLRKWPIVVQVLLTLFGVAGLMAGILYRQMQNTWTVQQSVLWVTGLTLAATIWTLVIWFLASRSKGAAFPLGLTIVFGSASALMLMKDSVLLGQIGGILTAGVGAFIVISAWSKHATISLPMLLVAIPALSAAMMRSYLIGGSNPFKWVDAALLVLASLLIGMVDLPFIRGRTAWLRAAVMMVVISIPLSLLLIPTTQRFIKEMREAGELGY